MTSTIRGLGVWVDSLLCGMKYSIVIDSSGFRGYTSGIRPAAPRKTPNSELQISGFQKKSRTLGGWRPLEPMQVCLLLVYWVRPQGTQMDAKHLQQPDAHIEFLL